MCGNPQTVAALSRWLGDWKERRRRGGTGDGDGRVSEERDNDGDESDEVSTYIMLLFVPLFALSFFVSLLAFAFRDKAG